MSIAKRFIRILYTFFSLVGISYLFNVYVLTAFEHNSLVIFSLLCALSFEFIGIKIIDADEVMKNWKLKENKI